MTTETIAVPRELVEFLLGEGPFRNCWFGDSEPGSPKFWWRKSLRACVPTTIHTDNTETLRNALEAVTDERDKLRELAYVGEHMHDDCSWKARCSELRAEVEALRRLLADAAEDVESWGAYASEYFQEKHDLAGCVTKYRKAAVGDQEDGGAELAAIAAMPMRSAMAAKDATP